MADIRILDVALLCRLNLDRRTLGRVEVQANCPLCSDSGNHLYLNTESNQFFCQRCRRGGGAVRLYALLEKLDEREAFQRLVNDSRIRVSEGFIPAQKIRQYELKPLKERHAVYLDFLTLLDLTTAHRMNLRNRGLSGDTIDGNLYKTVPLSHSSRTRILSRLSENYDLRGVPGFWFDERNRVWKMTARAGFFIPVCDSNNLIQGLQIRFDDNRKQKYCWFSSSKNENGCGAKSWIHVAGDARSDTLCITEGGLKADAASFLSNGALFAAVPGANSLQFLAGVIQELRPRKIVECLDMDKLTNEIVRAGAEKVGQIARPLCGEYTQFRWDTRFKGIDDYLLSRQNILQTKAA